MMLPAAICPLLGARHQPHVRARRRCAAVSGYAGLLLSYHMPACRPARRSSCRPAALYVVSVLFGPVGGLICARSCRRVISKPDNHKERCMRTCRTSSPPASRLPARYHCMPASARAAQETKLTVVASFSIIGDFVKNVGGDRIDVTTIVGPDGDAHVYEPRPADAKKSPAPRSSCQRPGLRRLDAAPGQSSAAPRRRR